MRAEREMPVGRRFRVLFYQFLRVVLLSLFVSRCFRRNDVVPRDDDDGDWVSFRDAELCFVGFGVLPSASTGVVLFCCCCFFCFFSERNISRYRKGDGKKKKEEHMH